MTGSNTIINDVVENWRGITTWCVPLSDYTFNVTVPEGTPADADVYIAGGMNGWDSSATKLTKSGNTYSVNVYNVIEGFQYKYVLHYDGAQYWEDRDNRQTGDNTTIFDAVIAWPFQSLSDAQTHMFAYTNAYHSLNNLDLPELGITAAWGPNQNPYNPIPGFVLTGYFVTLTAAEYDAIETKVDLKSKFDGAIASSTLDISIPSTDKLYFIAKNGENYFLVETTERFRDTNYTPANRVTISPDFDNASPFSKTSILKCPNIPDFDTLKK